MNNFLKTAFVAAGVVGTVGAVSTAQAASFNVVVDKIEMFTDNTDISTGITVFDPVNNIGESATRTVDLFDATAKLGTALNIATPPANTYETVLVHISEIEVSGTSVANDLKADLDDSSIGQLVGGKLVLPLGVVTNGGQLDLAYGGTLDGEAIPAPATTVSGLGFTLPKLNIFLDEGTVTAAGNLGSFPALTVLKGTTADDADVANLLINFDVATAFAGATKWTSGTDALTVGLFTADMPETPLQSDTISAADAAQTVAATTFAAVEFVDVPLTTVVPVIWYDADADGKLDEGEEYGISQDLSAPVLVTAADYDFAADAAAATINTSVISGTEVTDAAIRTLAGTVGIFANRTVSVTVALPDTTNQSDNDFSAGALTDTATVFATNDVAAAATGTVSIVYQINPGATTAVSYTLTSFEVTPDALTDTAEDIEFALTDVTAFDAVSTATFTSNTTLGAAGSLLVTGVPLAIDTLEDGNNTGTFEVAFELTDLPTTAGTVEPTDHVVDDATTGAADTSADPVAGTVALGNGAITVDLVEL